MPDNAKTPEPVVHRRDALGLAAAVAAFGAALGMNASGAKANDGGITHSTGQAQNKGGGQVKQQQKVTSGPAQTQIKMQNNQMKLNNKTPTR